MDKSKKIASAEQRLRLVSLVEADPQLKSGKFSSSFTKNEAKKRWITITEQLNSITGAKKTWEEWRKTWQDRKAHAKKKFAYLRRQANLTGGGPPPIPPTKEECFIINCLDEQCLVGHTDCQESKVSFIDLSNPAPSNRYVEKEIPQILDLSKTAFMDMRANLDLVQPGSTQNPTSYEHATQNAPANDVIPESTPDTPELGNAKPVAPTKATRRITKRTAAQRRLQQGLNTAETLATALKEKNEIKKKFYEEFINLMALQTKALADIATALKEKNK